MNKTTTRRINILRDSVARRIAAGEVIDRPQAVVRELLDNSIDAGATDISLYIQSGGIEEIRVVDNGSGMDEEDLKKCFLPHATSKITDFEDIYSTNTLGFRGEALSSIASCSRLSIISAVSADEPGNKLEISDGSLRNLSRSRGAPGTVISVRDLFYSMPGRRNFLKSSSAEAAQCRTMFIEKALPQTDINFRYFNNGKLKLFMPAADIRQRVLSAWGSLFRPEFLQSFNLENDGIKVSAALGTPTLYRKDRKYIHVFINNRRISDYSLVQAVDYAYSSYLPGGCHPVCFLFLEIPPEHVDFNIHPAKREVKFRNLPGIHHIVTEAVGGFLRDRNSFKAELPAFDRKTPELRQQKLDLPETGRPPIINNRVHRISLNSVKRPTSGASESAASERESIFRIESIDKIGKALVDTGSAEQQHTHSTTHSTPLVYLGQIFNLFLIFEHGENLMLIDQHAAHERIIYNNLSRKNPERQELLVPMSLNLERDEEISLERNLDDYTALGFELQKISDGEWLINSLPSLCSGMEDEILSFFKNAVNDAEELKRELYAMISCRTAIKDGDSIDNISAIEIAQAVLEMDNQRCPHGRPLIQLISRDQLFKMFGRTF
ncbi:MAG: DNA mismatch repair endonuclease MutL [Spirochaetales bacterium]|uniref:DNA mismatch repair protein MutL n=1 Tax=Candidatus Thalassospirochaeta sargassi TaxID=3119039 RepID=A0AAJ1MIH7_9SPIO|nr:DNA mismatch repair endonuclease MutL [Spirochaetales bacterium]